MAEYTTNYDLVKPAQEDFYNVDDQNRNMDKIDAALKAHDDALSGKADLGEDGKVKPEQLPDSTFDPTQDIEDAINEHNTSDSRYSGRCGGGFGSVPKCPRCGRCGLGSRVRVRLYH